MTQLIPRPSRFAANLTLVFAALAALGLFVVPYATYSRNFNGAGTLLLFPGRVLDVTGFAEKTLPSAAASLSLGWAVLAALILTGALAVTRSRWLWLAGLLALVLSVAAAAAFETSLGAEVQRELAGGVRPNRIPYRSGGVNLGLFLPMVAGVVALIAGGSAYPAWFRRLSRLRNLLVPLVAVTLAVVVGAAVVLLIQPVPFEGGPLTPALAWYGKADLVWFVYSTLFAPLSNLADTFQALTLATPLIFTGLSVAFAFRAGLFNIGAPGQLALGAIATMLVGVYVHLPPALLLPLTVLAAAGGGALWGALPGWLKARFGSSEVINTIMLNYVASALFIFLIGSNAFQLFGRSFRLPFKPPGTNQASSFELQPGARLPSVPRLLGYQTGEAAFLPLSPLLALAVFAALYLGLARQRRRVPIALGGALATLLLTWTWAGVRFQANAGVAGSNLNLAFGLALLTVVFFAVFMWRTAAGYALRAVGLSPRAAEYGGISVARGTVLAMTLSGAFAGLAASHYVMGGGVSGEYRLQQDLPYTTVGFDGITVALMGQSTPVGVVAASVLFGTLDTGGVYVSQQLNKVNKDIVTVLKALIVLFIAAGGFLSKRVTDPPPAALLPNLSKTSGEAREALGQKPVNTSSGAGEGPTAVESASPLNDGKEA